MIKLHNDSPSHLAYKAYCSGLDSQRDYNSENIKRNDATVQRLPFQKQGNLQGTHIIFILLHNVSSS